MLNLYCFSLVLLQPIVNYISIYMLERERERQKWINISQLGDERKIASDERLMQYS